MHSEQRKTINQLKRGKQCSVKQIKNLFKISLTGLNLAPGI